MSKQVPPPCPKCNGYGTADGKPAGTWARDFGPDDPGPCPDCDGTGDAPQAREESMAAAGGAA